MENIKAPIPFLLEHSGKLSLEHLLGVYRKLESWQSSSELCLAGLYQDIYGREVSPSEENRAKIAKRIGKKSEALIYLFHRLNPCQFLFSNKDPSIVDAATKKRIPVPLNIYKQLATLLFANEVINPSPYKDISHYLGLRALVNEIAFNELRSLQITVDDHLIPQKLAEQLAEKYKMWRFHFYYKSTRKAGVARDLLSHWNQKIVDGVHSRRDMSVELKKLKGEFPLEYQAWKLITDKMGDVVLLRAYLNAMTFGLEGIPHQDSQVDGDMTAVMYLNSIWEPMWAGETVIFDENNEIEQAVLPKLGRINFFPSKKWHAARALSRLCPALRIILVFKFCPRVLNKDVTPIFRPQLNLAL